MERPDFDAIQAANRRIGMIRNGDLEEVIAYARQLEHQMQGYQFVESTLHEAEEEIRYLRRRIVELEVALEQGKAVN